MIRLLVVENQAIVSKGMLMRLGAEPDFFVVGGTASSEEALELAKSLQPDVVLVDIDLPQMDEVELANQLRTFCPNSPIIFLSIQDDLITCERTARAGAAALVGKFLPADVLVTQIRHSCRII